MARVQLIIPDEDKMRYVQQARREGLTFSAWLRAAAQERLREKEESDRFKSVEDLNRFFAEIDARRGPEREPDWEEHERLIEESKLRGLLAGCGKMSFASWKQLDE